MISMMLKENRSAALGPITALLSVLLLFAWLPAAQADRGQGPGDRGAGRMDRNPGPGDRGAHPREFRDARHQHDRSYPARGQIIRVVPRDHRVVVHGGTRYYFSGGVWYRPQGPRFTVIAPPIGLFVPFLPPFFTTIWLHGVPYYYANEVYYGHRGSGYVVVEPPREEASPAPPPADQLFIYPRLGQNEQQQADDKYACHRWAVSQTGVDPTQPPGSSPESRWTERRADYQRAMSACLDGRGYTVK